MGGSMKKRLLEWIELDKSALLHNIQLFRGLIGVRKKIMAMVKANAYGHGMVEVSKIAVQEGIDWLGVHSIEEGAELCKNGFKCPILISGYVPLQNLEEAIHLNLRLTVYNRETIIRLSEICHKHKKKTFIHLKIETGTYRQGINTEDVLSLIRKAMVFPELVIEGISSHYANIEDTTDHSYAQFQYENFKRILQKLKENRIEIPIKHMSCTAAAMLFPETYFDMIRAGIGLYGLWPSKETYLSCIQKKRQLLQLKPVLSWKARIAQIKKAPQNSYVGYGCTYKTTRDTILAVVPIGYYDGYNRSFSNSSYVLIKGKRAPLRGRVAMDFIVVDISDIPGVKIEDEVVFIGQDGDESVTVDYLASLAGSINYEIVTRINPKIPRIVT